MKTFLKITAGILILFLLSFTLTFLKSGKDTKFIVKPPKAPLIIAHAGGQNLFPSNTMPAFDGSDSLGVDMLEMDILLTKDNVLVLHHNETIDSKTTGKGYVKDYTLEELRQFNYGYNFKDTLGNYTYRDKHVYITTLEDILKKYSGKYDMCIELKNKDEILGRKASEELYRLLVKYNMQDKAIISCFDDKTLNYFKKISDGKIRIATGKSATKTFVVLNLLHLTHLYTGKYDALQIPVEESGYRLDTEELIRAAHRKNIAVHYWTINDYDEIKRLIEIGADGIMTDRPDVMKRVLKDMGY